MNAHDTHATSSTNLLERIAALTIEEIRANIGARMVTRTADRDALEHTEQEALCERIIADDATLSTLRNGVRAAIKTAKETGDGMSTIVALMTVTIYMGYKLAYEQMRHETPQTAESKAS